MGTTPILALLVTISALLLVLASAVMPQPAKISRPHCVHHRSRNRSARHRSHRTHPGSHRTHLDSRRPRPHRRILPLSHSSRVPRAASRRHRRLERSHHARVAKHGCFVLQEQPGPPPQVPHRAPKPRITEPAHRNARLPQQNRHPAMLPGPPMHATAAPPRRGNLRIEPLTKRTQHRGAETDEPMKPQTRQRPRGHVAIRHGSEKPSPASSAGHR